MAPVTGTGRKKKVLVLFLLLLCAGAACVISVVWNSGVLSDNNPVLAPQIAGQINRERQALNLPPVQVDDALTNLAVSKSREVKIAGNTYAQRAASDPGAGTSILIIPKITWALSDHSFRQQFANPADNSGASLRANMANPVYRSVGIGVSGDGYNYYIVTIWK